MRFSEGDRVKTYRRGEGVVVGWEISFNYTYYKIKVDQNNEICKVASNEVYDVDEEILIVNGEEIGVDSIDFEIEEIPREELLERFEALKSLLGAEKDEKYQTAYRNLREEILGRMVF